jgi:hypothetical protein
MRGGVHERLDVADGTPEGGRSLTFQDERGAGASEAPLEVLEPTCDRRSEAFEPQRGGRSFGMRARHRDVAGDVARGGNFRVGLQRLSQEADAGDGIQSQENERALVFRRRQDFQGDLVPCEPVSTFGRS